MAGWFGRVWESAKRATRWVGNKIKSGVRATRDFYYRHPLKISAALLVGGALIGGAAGLAAAGARRAIAGGASLALIAVGLVTAGIGLGGQRVQGHDAQLIQLQAEHARFQRENQGHVANINVQEQQVANLVNRVRVLEAQDVQNQQTIQELRQQNEAQGGQHIRLHQQIRGAEAELRANQEDLRAARAALDRVGHFANNVNPRPAVNDDFPVDVGQNYQMR